MRTDLSTPCIVTIKSSSDADLRTWPFRRFPARFSLPHLPEGLLLSELQTWQLRTLVLYRTPGFLASVGRLQRRSPWSPTIEPLVGCELDGGS
jgi:hypothetical protein